MSRRLAWLWVATLVLGGCAGAPRVTEALGQWRSGRRAAAIELARGEVERFRQGNHLASADIDARLAEVDRILDEQTPIVLPDATGPLPDPDGPDPRDPMSPGPSVDRGLRADLAAPGATRTLRALRVVRRLALSRFANDLFLLIWRREPWQADGPLLASESQAMRSVAVKVAALRTLEDLR